MQLLSGKIALLTSTSLPALVAPPVVIPLPRSALAVLEHSFDKIHTPLHGLRIPGSIQISMRCTREGTTLQLILSGRMLVRPRQVCGPLRLK